MENPKAVEIQGANSKGTEISRKKFYKIKFYLASRP